MVMSLGIMEYVPVFYYVEAAGLTLSQLQSKFPHGKYWNHAGSSTNNPNGYTDTPCSHHGNSYCSRTDPSYSGGCGCNGFGGSIQCFGFANKCAYDVYGSLYTSWSQTTLSNLKPGDVIRYKNNGHSIFVTAVNGNTITYGDCNSDGHCKIMWNKIISKSTVASTLTAVYSAPYVLDNNVPDNPPTTATISIDKSEVKIGETFTLSLSSDSATRFYLSIFDADSGEKIIGERVSSTYKNAFLRAGHYSAYMTASNDNGRKDSNWIDFYVFGSPPTTANLSVDKTEITLGETVILSTSTDAYYTRIYTSMYFYDESNDGTLVYGGHIPYSFSYKPSKAGIYTAYVTASTHEGAKDSNWITFYVGKYNVKYDANGGSGAPSSQTKIYGKDLILSNTKPTRAGYTFIGWSTSNTATSATYQPGSSFKSNSNTTLYAVWKTGCEDNNHSYSYKLAKTPTTYKSGELTGTCAICSATTTVTMPQFSTTDYYYKVMKEATSTTTGTVRYTWKATRYGSYYFDVTTYGINYDANGGSGAPSLQTKTYGKDISLSDTKPIRAGYTFIGWSTNNNATSAVYQPGDNFTVNANTTLYAVWEKDCVNNNNSHSYSYKLAKTPTTLKSGELTGTCSNCSATITVTMPQFSTTDYNYEVIKEADCTSTGTVRYTWKATRYGNYYFDVTIPAIGHSYTSKVTVPTCTEKGYTTYTCACGYSYDASFSNAIGHRWDAGKITTNPTCTSFGERTYKCIICTTATSSEAVSALGHDFSESWTEDKKATCTEAGSKSHHCKREGCSGVADVTEIEAKGHVYIDTVTKESTCMETGITTYSCSCGDSYTESIEAKGHKWGEWVVTKLVTDTEDGEKQRTCEVCQEIETLSISKIGEVVNSVLPGDVNMDGQVNLIDAQLALKAALAITTLEEKQLQAADVDSKAGITLADAQMILKAALSIIKLEE